MTFRNKILFSIWGVVLSLLVITFFIINYWTRNRIEAMFSRELRTEYATVLVHEKLQSEQLIRACIVLAGSPRLRAVAELGDSRTAYELVRELSKTTASQVFVLTDRKGHALVELLRGNRDDAEVSGYPTIQDALRGGASTDVWVIHGAAYRVVSVPVVIETELVGTLTIGFEITGADIATLRRATNSNLLLVHAGATLLSTLDSAESGSLLPISVPFRGGLYETGGDTAGTTFRLATRDDSYLATAFLLTRPAGPDSSDTFYLIVKSLSREVRQSMASILGTFGVISLLFLAFTTVIGLIISRSITRPIRELVQGTAAISQGNYDYAIPVRGRDELSFLAQRFMEMSASLKEKITQLGQLNRDLLERNKDLDETLQKLRSAQQQLLRSERLAATGKLTAQLAHEINNPIHNIQSCLQTVLNRLPPETKGRDLIAVAHDEVNRLSRLTVQMLDFYRTSMVEDEMKPTNMGDVVKEIAVITETELKRHGVTMMVHVDDGLPLVRASGDKMKQVLLNLVANALDAMPGGGHLTIDARHLDGKVRITVGDDGMGIPKEHLDRIFDAFFTTKGKVSGVGLGLSVSYGIVNQHRGSIEVESAVGRGSAFTVVLPCEA